MERLPGYLKFRLTVCTIMTFLPRYLRASHAQSTFACEESKKRVEYLAGYFAELALEITKCLSPPIHHCRRMRIVTTYVEDE